MFARAALFPTLALVAASCGAAPAPAAPGADAGSGGDPDGGPGDAREGGDAAGPGPDGGGSGPIDVPPGSWEAAGLDPISASEDAPGCAAGSLPGRHYIYVDVAAAAGGTGARAAPLRSLAEAVAGVPSGAQAVICVAEGRYEESVGDGADVFGDGREITIAGGYVAGSGFAVRDAIGRRTHVSPATRSAAVITLGNIRAFTLDGLELSGGRHGVRVVGGYSAGRRVRVRNCHVHDNGVDGESDGAGLSLSGGDILVEHTIVEHNEGGRLGGGIFVGSPTSAERNRIDAATGELVVVPALARVERSIIRENTLRYDTPHGVGMAFGMNCQVVGNVIAGNHGFGVPGGGEAVGGGLIVQVPLATALIATNWIEGNVGESGGSGVFIDEAAIGTIVNNVLLDNVGEGQIGVDGRGSGKGEDDRAHATAIHNTVIGSAPAFLAQDSTLHVFNTLCWGAGIDVVVAGGGLVAEEVLIDGSRCAGIDGDPSAVTFGPDPVTCDPAFVDPTVDDYRIGETSDCAGRGLSTFTPARAHAGAWTAPPATDAAGVSRPNPPAIGAFEPIE